MKNIISGHCFWKLVWQWTHKWPLKFPFFKYAFGVICFIFVCTAEVKTKRLTSISYHNLIDCYSDLKNESLEFHVDLDKLRKTIDEKHPTVKSVLRYRKVLFTDPKLGAENHRLTVSLQKWHKGRPEYDSYLEKIDKENIAEIVPMAKEKFKNPIKDIPQKYLLDASIIEDEYLWLDTKPNKMEMSYKVSNDRIVELDLSSRNSKRQLKCESKKSQGVLCLCLKR